MVSIGGGGVPKGRVGFHSWFEGCETSNTVPPQKRVNEEYESDEMMNVDVVSDGDGLDMADIDYIIQKIAQLRNSSYTDVDIMRCLGITKAKFEKFGYVVRFHLVFMCTIVFYYFFFCFRLPMLKVK